MIEIVRIEVRDDDGILAVEVVVLKNAVDAENGGLGVLFRLHGRLGGYRSARIGIEHGITRGEPEQRYE
jgi:hypothetical protein